MSKFISDMIAAEKKWIKEKKRPAAVIIYAKDSFRVDNLPSKAVHKFGSISRNENEELSTFIRRSADQAQTFLAGDTVPVFTL